MTMISGVPDHTRIRPPLANPLDSDAMRRAALDRSVSELSPIVFSSLPRADQRRKGMMYLRGLLGATGRKSIRNIAAFLGDQVNDQGLHHFINDSTWEWAPMRETLGRHLIHHLPLQACVLHLMVIPKSGPHSVGVARTFSWERGQAVTAQQVIGVWGVSARTASPLNWWIHMPPEGTRGASRDGRTPSVAEAAGPATPEDSMVSAYLETVSRLHLPRCPVTLNAERLDAIRISSRLSAAGLNHIARISGDTWLLPDDPALPGWGESPLQASQIAHLAKAGRRRVAVYPTGTHGSMELVATVRVRLPTVLDSTRCGRGRPEFLLLAVGRGGSRWPEELWLTDVRTADPAALLRLVGHSRRVESRGMPRAERVGIRDFVGRSFAGWHRHATLASVAHAATELAERRLAA